MQTHRYVLLVLVGAVGAWLAGCGADLAATEGALGLEPGSDPARASAAGADAGGFNAPDIVGIAPFESTFVPANQAYSDEGILSYEWDFGDGQTDSAPAPYHLYQTPGVHTLQLTLGLRDGSTAVERRAVRVLPPVQFAARDSAGDGVIELGAEFTEPVEPFGLSEMPQFFWDFGDGTSGRGADVAHRYKASGTYTVALSLVVAGLTIPAALEQLEIVIDGTDAAVIADAGDPQTTAGGAQVQLDGSGSNTGDVEGNYSWTQVSGPPVQLSDPAEASPTFVAPVVAETTPLVFELVVSDGDVAESETVTVTINPATPASDDLAPPADSGGAGSMTAATCTTGVAPLGVVFDVIDESGWSSGVVQPPAAELDKWCYEWHFGDDPQARWPGIDRPKNQARGYVAAHVFEAPGAYRVTLTITSPAGQKHTYTQDINVTGYCGATYYVSAEGNDNNDGLSLATPWRTVDKVAANLAPNRAFLFRRGDTFSYQGPMRINVQGPGHFGAYGSGAKPVIQITGTGGGFQFGAKDWRIMDLDIVGPGDADQSSAVLFDVGKCTTQILMHRVTARQFRVGIGWSDYDPIFATPHEANIVSECDVPQAVVNGMYVGGRRLAIIGNRIGPITTSHVLRVWQARKAVISYNMLENPGPTRLSLKLHGAAFNDGRVETKYVVVSDNVMRGNTYCVSIAPQDTGVDERLSDVIFERNRIESSGETQLALYICACRTTVRNNIFNGVGASRWFTGVSVVPHATTLPPQDVKIVNNTIVRIQDVAESSGFTGVEVKAGAANTLVRNNAIVATDASSADVQFVVNAGTNSAVDHNATSRTDIGFQDGPANNFGLRPESSAVGAGADDVPVFDDYAWQRRVRGALDAGAFALPR